MDGCPSPNCTPFQRTVYRMSQSGEPLAARDQIAPPEEIPMTAAYVQEDEFNELLTTETLVVLDCTATWCGPCKVIAPFIDQLADAYAGRAKVVKLDIDANKALSKKLGIRSIPNVLIFKQGEQVESIVGRAPYEDFSAAVEKHL